MESLAILVGIVGRETGAGGGFLCRADTLPGLNPPGTDLYRLQRVDTREVPVEA